MDPDITEVIAVRKVAHDELWHIVYRVGDRETYNRVPIEKALAIEAQMQALPRVPVKTEDEKQPKEPLPEEPPFVTGTYEHYSGRFHNAITLFLNEATLEWWVLYRPLWIPGGTMWGRPLKEWNEDVNGVPRYKLNNAKKRA